MLAECCESVSGKKLSEGQLGLVGATKVGKCRLKKKLWFAIAGIIALVLGIATGVALDEASERSRSEKIN